MNQPLNIFLLTSQWKDNDSFPLQFFAQSENGPVLLRFSQEKFTFFIEQDVSIQSFGNSVIEKQIPLKTFDGKNVKALYCSTQSDYFNLKRYCQDNGIRTYESDIWPAERFLMERFIFGQAQIIGPSHQQGSLTIFDDPQMRTGQYRPSLNVLSFDIETGVDGSIYSIGVDYSGKKNFQHVYMRADFDKQESATLTYLANEKAMIQKFIQDLNNYDPDVIIGWHVIGFDLKFIAKRCEHYRIPFDIGRNQSEIILEDKKGMGTLAKIPGRIVLDGPPTLRAAFLQFKNFKLETVASEVLRTGKDIASDGGKVTEIERRFKEDKEALAKYNLLDCTLVTGIYEKLDLVNFSIERVINSGLLFDKLGISTASFDHYMLPLFHRNGLVAPNSSDLEREDASTGGMVIEPKVGHHKNVAVFDFKSLYPSIIRTFKIDPFSRIHKNNDTIELPNGLHFSKTKHFLPEIIEKLLERRAWAKQNKNHSLNLATKILMNSFYGVMGSLRCRFYHADLPAAITQTGHWILRQSIEFFQNRNLEVLYGDTDSLFVKLPSSDYPAEDLSVDLNDYLKRLILDEYGLVSYLELEYEKLYSDIFFSTMRDSTQGAKKRYVGLIEGKLDFVGMEYVRSDWTDVAKRFQYELFENFFMDVPVEGFIKQFVADLKKGKYDDLLVYTKRLSKDPKEYTKNIPQHVKAALLVNHTGPYRLKEVSYVMTLKGPIPVQNEIDHIDYQHYIDKQIRPLADQVLKTKGMDFDSLEVGDQLTMF